MDKRDILHEVIEQNGKERQLYICIEELSELAKELCKDLRGIGVQEHIDEEMADVAIIMEQLKIIYDNEDNYLRWLEKKVNRLKDRLEEGEDKR